MRIVHRFLCWFPLWAAGSSATFAGLAIGAAQVWPNVKIWDEVQRDNAVSIMSQPLFWAIAVIVIAVWGWLTWSTWPAREPDIAEPLVDAISREKQEWGGNKISERSALVSDCRDLAYGFMEQGGGPFHFREFLEGHRRYADIRRYLAADFITALHKPRTYHVPQDGARYPVLVQWFLDEIDRLEQEWSL